MCLLTVGAIDSPCNCHPSAAVSDVMITTRKLISSITFWHKMRDLLG